MERRGQALLWRTAEESLWAGGWGAMRGTGANYGQPLVSVKVLNPKVSERVLPLRVYGTVVVPDPPTKYVRAMVVEVDV